MTEPQRLFPKWLTDSLADDLEKRADRVAAHFGEDAAAEAREIVADLREPSKDGDDRD